MTGQKATSASSASLRRVHSKRPVVFSIFFCVAVIVAWLVGNIENENFGLWLLVFVLIAIGFAPLVSEWLRGEFDLFNTRNAFLVVYLLTFSGWLIYVLLTGEYYFLGSVDSHYDLYRNAMIMACAGLVAFQLGNGLGFGKIVARKMHVPRTAFSAASVRLVAVCLAIAALGSYYVLVSMNGGLRYFLSHLWQFHSTNELLGMAPILAGVSLASTGFLLWYAYIG